MCSFTVVNLGDDCKNARKHSRKLDASSWECLSWFILMPNYHVMPDGSEHPIVYASHTLQVNTTTLKWSRKLFPLIFGVCKIHPYLNGWRFTIVMNHKPLITILGWKQGIPTLAAAYMQCWALLLSAFVYDIPFWPTGSHGNVDGPSRLPLPARSMPSTSDGASMFDVAQMQWLPVSSSEL